MEIGDIVISKSNVYYKDGRALKAGKPYRIFDHTEKEVKIFDDIGQYDFYKIDYFKEDDFIAKRNKLLRISGIEYLIWETPNI